MYVELYTLDLICVESARLIARDSAVRDGSMSVRASKIVAPLPLS